MVPQPILAQPPLHRLDEIRELKVRLEALQAGIEEGQEDVVEITSTHQRPAPTPLHSPAPVVEITPTHQRPASTPLHSPAPEKGEAESERRRLFDSEPSKLRPTDSLRGISTPLPAEASRALSKLPLLAPKGDVKAWLASINTTLKRYAIQF